VWSAHGGGSAWWVRWHHCGGGSTWWTQVARAVDAGPDLDLHGLRLQRTILGLNP
jgi:hypothetical protein